MFLYAYEHANVYTVVQSLIQRACIAPSQDTLFSMQLYLPVITQFESSRTERKVTELLIPCLKATEEEEKGRKDEWRKGGGI